jgi:hypothetical protein
LLSTPEKKNKKLASPNITFCGARLNILTCKTNQAAMCYNAVTMAAPQPIVTTTQNQPLIGIPFEENGKEFIRYFSEETQADRAQADKSTEEALKLAGVWSDLSWEEMGQALDHIRHDSKPTPPIEGL